MCGIWGLYKTNNDPVTSMDIKYSYKAANLMYNRGPDSEGYWNDDICG